MRGSEWRKWDLHVHTPESGMANEFKCEWDCYVQTLFKKAIEHKIAVIGITDYFTIDGYKKLRQDYLENDEKLSSLFTPLEIAQIKKICIIPNIEFRLDQVIGKDRLNYHVLFSNEVAIRDIEENFLHEIDFVYEAEPSSTSNKRKLKRCNLIELGELIKRQQPDFNGSDFTVGCTTAVVSARQIEDIFASHKDLFGGKYLVIMPVDEDLPKIPWNSQGHMVRKYYYQSANAFFATNQNTIDFGLGYKHPTVNDFITEFKSLKPCVIGSDAHKLDSLFVFPNKKNCWIKADASFEGLKQILYEPEERVKLQISQPDEKSLYQVLDSIDLDEPGFWVGRIYLNPNLNTIIGGRSTGKSSLLKAIAAKHNGLKDVDKYLITHLDSMSIKWADGGNEEGHKIDYYSQGYMHDIASSRELTNKLIETILQSKDNSGLLGKFYAAKSQLERVISADVFGLFRCQKDLLKTNNDLNETGNKSGVEQQIKLLKAKISDIQRNCSLSHEELISYNELQSRLSDIDKEIALAERDVTTLQHLKTLSPITTDFENTSTLKNLSFRQNSAEVLRLFQEIRNRTILEWQSLIDKIYLNTTTEKEKLLKKRQSILESDLYKRGHQSYENNKELQSLSARLNEEDKKLNEISLLESKAKLIVEQCKQLFSSILKNHIQYNTEVELLVNELKVEYDGLSITVLKEFHKDDMREFLEARCNLRSAGRPKFITEMVEHYSTDIEKYAGVFLSELVNDRIELKNSYTPQNVAAEFFSHEWFSLSYQLKYQYDLFEMMSEGKQAFVILKLLLEFSDKKCPILIDQPEDSLDNRAIYQELVEYIKTKKKERQIILVTHNSNVVVSADAENVIVANQNGTNCRNEDDCKFQYINGALENTQQKNSSETIILKSQGIREHVCEILEGGKDAFEKRERKYGFK